MKNAANPASLRLAPLQLSRLRVRSVQLTRRPIQTTGWPMRLKSQSGYPTIASISRASSVVTMVIDDHSLTASAPLMHGGDLDAARRMFPGAPEPFIDLSTGINPFPYPLP